MRLHAIQTRACTQLQRINTTLEYTSLDCTILNVVHASSYVLFHERYIIYITSDAPCFCAGVVRGKGAKEHVVPLFIFEIFFQSVPVQSLNNKQ